MRMTLQLLPDCLPVSLDINEEWLAEQMLTTGQSAEAVIYGEIERGFKASAKKVQEAMRAVLSAQSNTEVQR